MCEVEIFGLKKDAPDLTAPEINRALNGTAWQISTYQTWSAGLGVDGGYDPVFNTGKTCQVRQCSHFRVDRCICVMWYIILNRW